MSKPQFMPIPPNTSLMGKTILITGGNSGLGLEFARQALTLKAPRVLISVRENAKGDAAIATLRANADVKASNPDAKLDYIHLELDSYLCGRTFVRKVYEQVPELDILVCNGGTNFFKYEMSCSGHERLMQVHCYTHFLIALSLIPLLCQTAAQRGPPTRVPFLSSYSHVRHTVETNPVAADGSVIGHFDDRKNFVYGKRYQDAKLVINAFFQRLTTRVSSSKVVINCACPGIVETGINRNLPLWIKPFMYFFFKITARPVVEGGRVLVRAAVVVGAESHGKYLQKGEIHSGAPFLPQPTGKQFIEKLWAEVVAEMGKFNPALKAYA